jgi:putative DNA primase/helicase
MSIQKAIAALSFVPAHDRAIWVRMGMAMKAEFLDDGFEPWDAWSQGAQSYTAQAAKTVWRSIGAAGKIGIGSLFHEAAANGWRDHGQAQGPLSAQELARRQGARDARAASLLAEDARKQRGYRQAAIDAQRTIDNCAMGTHFYLNAKGLSDVQALVSGSRLIVPMRNLDTHALQGIQTIDWNAGERRWDKKMAPGMRARGAVLRLGNQRAQETFLCEGYATGLSIDMALRRLRLNASVLVCFSAANMVHVAALARGRRFVVADNDASLAGQAAASKTGLAYCMSERVGEDANDLHQRAGIVALCKLLIDVRRRAG